MGRKITFAKGEFYHVYHRGNDKRQVFHDVLDHMRFMEGLLEFNTTESIGSIYDRNKLKKQGIAKENTKLVQIIAYNILDNHFHLVVRLNYENGLSIFMKSQMGGYTKYYNKKYGHSGPIFAGPYKCKHIQSQEYLDYVIRYVYFNHLVHRKGNQVSFSSWYELDKKQNYNYKLVDGWVYTCDPERSQIYMKESLVIIDDLIAKRELQKKERNKELIVDLLIE